MGRDASDSGSETTPAPPRAAAPVAASGAVAAGVGAALRAARTSSGKSIEQIAARLCIKASFLRALEKGDIEGLPGPAYALGFVRSYAEFLELDVPTTLDRFRREIEPVNTPAELIFPTPVSSSRPVPGGPVVVVSGALLVAAVASWYALQSEGPSLAERIATPPGLATPSLPRTAPVAALVRPPAETSGGLPQPDVGYPPSIALSPAPLASAPAPADSAATPSPIFGASPALTALEGDVAPHTAVTPRPERTEIQAPNAQITASPPPQTQPETRPVDVAALAIPDAPPSPVVSTPPPPALSETDEEPGFILDAIAEPSEQAPAPADSQAPVGTLAQQVEALSEPPAPAVAVATPRDTAVTFAELPPIPPAEPRGVGAAQTGRVYGRTNPNVRVTLTAQADIWVQVRDSADNNVFTRLLHSGDVYRVPDRNGLRLHTGNAGLLRIMVDGHPVPAIGTVGAVRRDVPLDPVLLAAGQTGEIPGPAAEE